MNWKDVHKNFSNYKLESVGREKEIISNRVTRTGLEFADFFVHKDLKAVVLWGNDEYLYLKQFDEKLVKEKIEKIFQLTPPLVVLSRSFPAKGIILELAKKYDISILSTKESSADLTNYINTFLTEKLSKKEYLHGNLIELFGLGVLLMGKSGLGKSETSIELIKHGHMFIADDAIVCSNVFNKIIGRAPKRFFGFLEVRGLGIINASRVFGIEKVKESTQINVIIELVEFDPKVHTFERLGKDLQYKEILGVKIPYYLIPITPGKKTSDMIEVIVAQLKLMLSGYNSFKEMEEKSMEDDDE
ncbi:HPr kinase/phosphorylase [Malacoplasma penetrans]|uniref:HPr kinase/phosphorylase n=1 Tax=Malacoplasma penetrans (strain HF-2) TaxID=272633 RepID=HPRK_MALP2|nr:HPr(Ser) kinase/phosphatase [Malacoplasma penetrans]Q8EWA5.1 RecName: Full=HPr kinase/phosphorylase; Short=HPrK/P; AltName: Full=HPr(Ser) kinase/phosphorylase [Malacoplasma penetrans HF-2]RXY96783.1 HPr kinase/phosphorylase [Malacoplasma penetrans]BAC44091.1 HPr serine-threonine protein kinase [Malacoplasma penetrans HF-2]